MKRKNHRWKKKTVVSIHKSERECQNGCGIVKATFHQHEGGRNLDWREFWRGLDKVAGKGDPTPVCERVEVAA